MIYYNFNWFIIKEEKNYMSYNGVWTMAETNDGKLRKVAFELLTRGRKLADKLDVEPFIIYNRK